MTDNGTPPPVRSVFTSGTSSDRRVPSRTATARSEPAKQVESAVDKDYNQVAFIALAAAVVGFVVLWLETSVVGLVVGGGLAVGGLGVAVAASVRAWKSASQ